MSLKGSLRWALLWASIAAAGPALLSCGGGGGGGTPGTPGNAAAPTNATGEPSDTDWTRLAGEFAAMSIDSLTAALSAGAGLSLAPAPALPSRPFRLQGLNVPGADISISAAYFCCGAIGTLSHLTMQSAIRLILNNAGLLSFSQTIETTETTAWAGVSGGRWRIMTEGLRVSGDLETTGGVVNPQQQFQVTGTFVYVLPDGREVRAQIDVLLTYQNFETGSPTIRGSMGPVRWLTDQPLPTSTAPRCSRPLEGCSCIPGCSGSAPCTAWPRCPA